MTKYAKDSRSSHLEQLGQRILAEANDLKRTPEALADELGYDLSVVNSVISGRANLEVVQSLITRMCNKYPISLAKIWVEQDDTIQGVKIMRAEETKKSARIFSRKNRSNEEADYYEYRDTVMSRTADFKPEWIQPIRVVKNNSSDNPDVAYNKGHFLHQCTFFIGEVNFYWEIKGIKHCVEMNTGDSNYITPFIPHSFASRNENKLGIIIAVTFGSEVSKSLNEFIQIGPHNIEAMTDNLRSPIEAFRTRLQRYLNVESLTNREFTDRLFKSGLKWSEASKIADGKLFPSVKQIELIAKVLNLQEQDLLVSSIASDELVVIKRSAESDWRPFPNSNQPEYQIKELARTRHLPYLRGFDITVVEAANTNQNSLCHHLHEYIYNYGDEPIYFSWAEDQTDLIEPGDSVYIQPMIKHNFSLKKTTGEGRLVAVRIPGGLTDSVINEFSKFPTERRNRAMQETDKWF